MNWEPGKLAVKVNFYAYRQACLRYEKVLEGLGCKVEEIKYADGRPRKIVATGEYLTNCLDALEVLSKYVAKKPDPAV